jgi:hypothetical protein
MFGAHKLEKMNEDTQKLWIELDGAEEHGMFYLASPCKAEVGLFAGEVAIGIVVAAIASPSGPGSIAAYCATTTAVSAAGAWLLAGTMAADKWPHGIDQ